MFPRVASMLPTKISFEVCSFELETHAMLYNYESAIDCGVDNEATYSTEEVNHSNQLMHKHSGNTQCRTRINAYV